MARPKVIMDDDLRTVLRLSRQQSRLTQAVAAEKTGISEVWWSQIETGIAEKVLLDTFVSMLVVVNAPQRALNKINRDDIAHAVAQRLDWFGGDAL